MLSIQPKWVAKIMNGEKTIEVRKTRPNCELPIDVYIYCTKDKQFPLVKGGDGFGYKEYCNAKLYPPVIVSDIFNGKVVAKFTLNTVEEIPPMYKWRKDYEKHLEENACISQKDLFAYLDMHKPTRCGYAWHISNLVIFDKPKELSEFYKIRCKNVDENNDCLYCNNNRHCSFAEIDYNPDYSINAYICGKPKKPLTHAPQSRQYVEEEE